MNRIDALRKVATHNLTRVDATLDYDRITDCLISLANVLADFDGETECIWYLGECEDFTLDDLIAGAYWHYADFHSGQWSKGYAALSAIGQVFSPGMSSLDDESTEKYVYDLLADIAK